MKRLITLCLALSGLLTAGQTEACTSIIITGKATPDGRPLMWKHRDTGVHYNHITFEKGEKYAYLGLTNSTLDGDIWTGTNEAGFSIMNTASYNLKDDNVQPMDAEGKLMRRALEICRTTHDFEHYLDTLSRPMRVEANFGVIDAHGGAAYYETNNSRYWKKDANDPTLAPEGYLIYTNYSFEGREGEGKGYIRYDSARKIFTDMKGKGFTPKNIFTEASASFYHSLLNIDLKKPENSPNRLSSGWVVEQDFIPRNESTAAIVIQGVKEGMNPELTTMWTELGYPPTAIALPLWVKMGEAQPVSVSYTEEYQTAPLCYYATSLKEKAYPIHPGNGQKYLHWEALWNGANTGYMQVLRPYWEKVYGLFEERLPEWEKKGLDTQEIRKLYQQAEKLIREGYREVDESLVDEGTS